MIKLNKKGEEEEGLTANTLGTVLGVTATLIIIFFIYLAITRIWSDPGLEAAQEIADRIQQKINIMEANQRTTMTIQGSEKLDGWVIEAWSKESQERPDKCFLSSCVCLCKGQGKEACQNKGICREIETDSIYVLGERFKPLPLVIENKRWIEIPSNILLIYLQKDGEGRASISTDPIPTL